MRLRSWRIQIATSVLLSLLSMGALGQGQAGKLGAVVDNGSSREKAPAQDSLPSCWDPMPPTSGKSTQYRPPHHSVALSWKASVPVSKSPQEAVKGYYVYRSRSSHRHTLGDRMNAQPIVETGCVDRVVKPRTTYFYSVRALSQGGAQSVFSDEVKAVVPYP
jgi:hypothetical protein